MKSEHQHLNGAEAHLHQRGQSSAICGHTSYAGNSIKQRNLFTLLPKCRVKQSHRKKVGGWRKSEMVAIDLQPHTGNAA